MIPEIKGQVLGWGGRSAVAVVEDPDRRLDVEVGNSVQLMDPDGPDPADVVGQVAPAIAVVEDADPAGPHVPNLGEHGKGVILLAVAVVEDPYRSGILLHASEQFLCEGAVGDDYPTVFSDRHILDRKIDLVRHGEEIGVKLP